MSDAQVFTDYLRKQRRSITQPRHKRWMAEAGVYVDDSGRAEGWAVKLCEYNGFPVVIRRRVLRELADRDESTRAAFMSLLDLGQPRAALEHIELGAYDKDNPGLHRYSMAVARLSGTFSDYSDDIE